MREYLNTVNITTEVKLKLANDVIEEKETEIKELKSRIRSLEKINTVLLKEVQE